MFSEGIRWARASLAVKGVGSRPRDRHRLRGGRTKLKEVFEQTIHDSRREAPRSTESEHALFAHYAAAARAVGASSGAITLLVSHRFSTVRMADLIAVLDAGQLIEFGTHAELMARRGHYAELFNLSARGYT